MQDTVSNDNDLLETSIAARELEIAKETVIQLEKNGKLRAIRTVGGRRLFRRIDVLKLKAEREAKRA